MWKFTAAARFKQKKRRDGKKITKLVNSNFLFFAYESEQSGGGGEEEKLLDDYDSTVNLSHWKPDLFFP